MFPRALSDRVETLINELIEEGGIDTASLASILVAAQDSVNHGYSVELSRRVWLASNELRPQESADPDVLFPPLPADGRGLSPQVV
jgi:hypothetical protein